MKLICLLCKKISLSKTLSSRNFRMKYNLAAGGGGGVGWEESMLNKFKLF